MNILKWFSNPFKIYLFWFILVVLFSFIGIPILSMGHSGGEQKPLTLLSYTLEWFFYGLLLITLITPFLFLAWFKNYWYISVGIALLSFFFLTL